MPPIQISEFRHLSLSFDGNDQSGSVLAFQAIAFFYDITI